MIINKTLIEEMEHFHRKTFSEEFKSYLLVEYADEPFPYKYSEQDLYENVRRDLKSYEAGELNIVPKSLTDRWQEEREYLRNLYIEKAREVSNLKTYVKKLEQIISEHGLEITTMI